MRHRCLAILAVSFCRWASAQEQNTQNNPPPVLRIYVEQVKPGKAAAHEKAESAFVRAFAKANYPAHYLGLNAMSGADEVWFVEEHRSFAEVETSEKAADAPALKAELDQAYATDGEYISGARSLMAVYRPDLSYRPAEGVAAFSKTRYFNIITVRLKMGMEARLVSTVSELVKVYNSAQFLQPEIVYQVISGAPAGTYLLFEPMRTLAEWDKYPAVMQSLRLAGGRRFDAVQKDFAEMTLFEEGRLMSINPRMSYVSKETAAGDPDFWRPKPQPPAGKAAARRPARQKGQ